MMKHTITRLNQADTQAFLWVASRAQQQGLLLLARLVSRLADGPGYLAAGILLALFEPVAGPHFLALGLCCYALEIPIYVLLKKLFKRARPFRRLNCWHLLVPADEFSFPSGHTAAAAVFASLLGMFYVDSVWLMVAFVALVGAARVVMGVHYPGDILAGAALGLLCVCLITFSARVLDLMHMPPTLLEQL
ncbi:phosphatase PAP2 family protein [Simiduia sp. 21SJ11W-1]|uniref:phosphatase PAP2 family protein n=1 Tax=Simiduia sp. 21SJ11W-1 TaxID=2909669 RepID=UPI0020A0EB90|nr:phosphatase PAP2 family protein [Simiduia sp. 21SJ11W-1]UTA48472.1 phosphatase PAP2 family protein [Simiduia sp. 21SJ11W-1]